MQNVGQGTSELVLLWLHSLHCSFCFKGLLLRFIFLYCGGWCYWHLKQFLNFQGFPKLTRFPRRTRAILTVAGDATSKSKGSKIKFVVGASWMISPLFKQSWKKKNNGTLFRYAEAGRDPVARILSWIWHSASDIYFVYQTQMNRKQRGLLFHVMCVG